jgi:hypothetical protein
VEEELNMDTPEYLQPIQIKTKKIGSPYTTAPTPPQFIPADGAMKIPSGLAITQAQQNAYMNRGMYGKKKSHGGTHVTEKEEKKGKKSEFEKENEKFFETGLAAAYDEMKEKRPMRKYVGIAEINNWDKDEDKR